MSDPEEDPNDLEGEESLADTEAELTSISESPVEEPLSDEEPELTYEDRGGE